MNYKVNFILKVCSRKFRIEKLSIDFREFIVGERLMEKILVSSKSIWGKICRIEYRKLRSKCKVIMESWRRYREI